MEPNPLSRNFFVLSALIDDTPVKEKRRIVIPNYGWLGERVCAILSILFGKRFDHHGFLISHGSFYVPDMSQTKPTVYYTAGPNSHVPRKDLGLELNLIHFGRVATLFTDEALDERFVRILYASSRFYVQIS